MRILASICLFALACGGPGAAAQQDDYDRLHGQADRCPDEPEDEDGFADEDGCPDNDNDGDGILDQHDLCPDDAEDIDLFEDADGCPDPDNDQDRIVDADDICPDEAETYNGTEDEDGCPDHGKVEVITCVFPIIDRIYFQPNSSRISEVQAPLLDAIAATLEGNPDIDLVAIAGNAASNEKDPKALGLVRAEAVAGALIQRGVDPDRLKIVSAGASAQAKEDHERNRRVDFHILEGRDGAVGHWNGETVVPVDP